MNNFKVSGCEMLTYEMLEPKVQKWNIDGFEIITFQVSHNVPNHGIIINCKEENVKFCYCTDFNNLPKIEGITHWLFETNYIEGFIDDLIDNDKDLRHLGFNNHCSAEFAVNYFKKLSKKPELIMCCHLSSANAMKNKILKLISPLADKVMIAEKGAIYGK